MKRISDRVWWVTAAIGAHCYLVETDEALVLVDPGLRAGLNRVARQLHANGRPPRGVTDILLTHYDVDHASSAATWQQRTGARAWLGGPDAAILTGASPVPDTWFRRLMAATGLPRLPGGLHLVEAGGLPCGLTALPTPGHTPGHVSFGIDDVVLVGDAALVDAAGRLTPVPGFMMSDVERGEASRAMLDDTAATWLCAGHSAPARRR
ncbi:MAG: MBL fold metallo-hydrolase [Propionicimonas sp.]|nr:MBL fold metallo-hydrolase [Propionicimonas sp.]